MIGLLSTGRVDLVIGFVIGFVLVTIIFAIIDYFRG